MNAGFTALDWAVVAGVLGATTWVGRRRAGRQDSLRDFFLGGRRLPWYAVSASIVATEISAITYVSLPSVVFREGGNLTYLQLGLVGSFLARCVVGYVLVPAYYERELYSPYDYMGRRLGEGVRRLATGLFALGGVLGQSARVYLTALVLHVLLAPELAWLEASLGIDPLVSAVAAIAAVALLWTLLGGIAAVVWTDAILFLSFLLGVGVLLAVLEGRLEGGLPEALQAAHAAGKLQLLDFDPDPTRAYTFWAALFATTWTGVGAFGTDQLMAQRIFCCRGPREARRAVIASILGMGVTAGVAVVGIGLWAFYAQHPLGGEALAAVGAQPDRILPLFVREVVPVGLRGLVVAGVFAAAVSSLDSILAALSQTTLSLFVPDALPEDDPRSRLRLRASRLVVVAWAVVLGAAAIGIESVASRYDSLLDLALAMATYTGGALVAGFFLAFLPLRLDGSGLLWSAPLSVLCVYSLVWHGPGAQALCAGAGAGVFGLWIARRARPAAWAEAAARWLALQTVALALALGGIWALARFGIRADGRVLAFPWYVPVGSSLAFTLGWLLDRQRLEAPGTPGASSADSGVAAGCGVRGEA